MKKFLDSNIRFKNKTVTERMQLFNHKNKKLPLPTEIEKSIQEIEIIENENIIELNYLLKKISFKALLWKQELAGWTSTTSNTNKKAFL